MCSTSLAADRRFASRRFSSFGRRARGRRSDAAAPPKKGASRRSPTGRSPPAPFPPPFTPPPPRPPPASPVTSFPRCGFRSTSRTPRSITTFRCCSARSATRRTVGPSVLSWNRYGKSRVRLVKLKRQHDPHEIVDLTIDIQLEGAFDAVYVDGDNGPCFATDTMKNTVYAMARQDPIEHVEAFALRLAAHFTGKPAVARARISAVEHRWDLLSAVGRPHPHAFVQPGGEQWTT